MTIAAATWLIVSLLYFAWGAWRMTDADKRSRWERNELIFASFCAGLMAAIAVAVGLGVLGILLDLFLL